VAPALPSAPGAVIPRRVSRPSAPPARRRECRAHVARATWSRHPHRMRESADWCSCGWRDP
jgi:hypothetical protein